MLLALSTLNAEAARRMGGGKSTGQQSSNVTQREAAKPAAPSQAAAAKPATPAAAPAAPAKRPWGAMLGGLAAGLGLAWLASSLGLGEAFGNMLMFALLAMVAVAVIGYFLRSRKGGAAQQQGGLAYQGAGQTADAPASLPQYNPEKVGNDASARPWESQNTRFDPTPAANSPSPAHAGGSMIGSAIGGSQPTGFRDLLNSMMKRRWYITAMVLGGFMLIMGGIFASIIGNTVIAGEWKEALKGREGLPWYKGSGAKARF